MKTSNTEKITELATRIYNYIAPWDREDATIEDITKDIQTDPNAVIAYLLDQLEAIVSNDV